MLAAAAVAAALLQFDSVELDRQRNFIVVCVERCFRERIHQSSHDIYFNLFSNLFNMWFK